MSIRGIFFAQKPIKICLQAADNMSTCYGFLCVLSKGYNMLDITRFSNLFSSLGSGFSTGLNPSSYQPSAPPVSKFADTVPQDVLDINSVGSNQASGSFDQVSKQSPVAVTNTGIYRPTQVQHQLSTSLNFSFNLSLNRATAIQRPVDTWDMQSGETKQLSYQELLAAKRDQSGSYQEVRRFQTDLFFKRTRSLSQHLSSETGQHLESTGQQVSRRFEFEISLDFSFLKQFNVQSETLAQNEDTLDQYLNGVDGLAASGAALQSFFDEVDRILADTEGFVQDTLGDFLNDVKAAFGVTDQEAVDFTAMVADEITSFFNDVDEFLQGSRQTFMAPSLFPTQPETEGVDAIEQALVA